MFGPPSCRRIRAAACISGVMPPRARVPPRHRLFADEILLLQRRLEAAVQRRRRCDRARRAARGYASSTAPELGRRPRLDAERPVSDRGMPAAIAMPDRWPDITCSRRFSHPSDEPTGRSMPVSRIAWPSKWLRVRCGIAIACTTASSLAVPERAQRREARREAERVVERASARIRRTRTRRAARSPGRRTARPRRGRRSRRAAARTRTGRLRPARS